ncbi:stage VI sporulation protein F [Brevibacillus composti]|uniref:Stage VI sporulation protein F n=1 Tax=Brevibacillus composti TaxID=2796470 RepID=A0A7T5JMC6_9BACL|nr:stage VI sporulation protein F [Brevibacillus composti]QQE72962.1 stage VI sporulation protein F [Brevibacillus composti]QUO40040.1 stage VI sporulation protein F [Brevibacillus composti]
MAKTSDLLKKVNQKSKKKLSMSDIKSLAKGYKKKDFKDDKKLKELIKKVSKAVGFKLSDDQLASVRKQVKNRLPGL